MKVELFAILKQHTAADTAARQSIYSTFMSMSDDVEPFLSFEDPKAFYAELGKAFGRADVIVAAADQGAFLQQKWNMLKALGLKSEICPAVLKVIRENGEVSDSSMKAHALMPKDAAVFLTHDGLFSGFAIESGSQTLLYLPMIDGRAQEILAEGVRRYFAARMQPAVEETPPVPQLNIPDNNERFVETARILSDCDISVAFAATQTIRYVQNGVRANPLFGDAFIPSTVEDDPSSRDSATERMACLADSARKEIGTTLGAAISNIYTVGNGNKEMFLYVSLADSRNSHVRKIVGPAGISTADLVALATDALYTMLQDYAGGKPFPPADADVAPINLFEEGIQSAQESEKQKSGTAVKIAICVLIAVILCVLIGFYFKDDVAAFFDNASAKAAIAAEETAAPERWTLAESQTEAEEMTEEAAADVDLALFGTASDGSKKGISALSAYETPVYVDLNTAIRDYAPAAQDVTYTTTPTTVTTTEAATQAATAAATTSTTTAATTAAATTAAAATAAPGTTTAKEKADVNSVDMFAKILSANEEQAATTEETVKPTETTTEKATTTKATTTMLTLVTKPSTTTTTAPQTTGSLLGGLFGSTQSDGTFTFTVYGFGHGVGMSQMGALAYARQGWSCEAILQHYYPGTAFAKETPPATVIYDGKARDTREYLVRVVQQEIGGSARASDIEALKAQAIAAYSFTRAKGNKVLYGQVAYSTLADEKLSSAVRSAVDSVFGTILTYGGKPALAAFYSSSAGKTTSSKSVWGGDYAYLPAGITSPEEVSITTVTISAEDFKAIIDRYNAKYPQNAITLSGSPSQWIEILGHDGARGTIGYVTSIRVGNKVMDGNAFRTVYNGFNLKEMPDLRSHCFSLSV